MNRLDLFYKVLGKAQPIFRGARMKKFEEAMSLRPGLRILDLGGTTEIWQFVKVPLDITIVNLPGIEKHPDVQSHHRFTYLDGDATKLDFADQSFDIVFSNSVIEHVGGAQQEAALAKEVRRLAPAYWVQTPSIWFPLEPHSGIPFWWLMPGFARDMLHRRWAKTVPAWNEMVRGTTVLSRRDMRSYFPDARHEIEWLAGLPKSYYAYRAATGPFPSEIVDAANDVAMSTGSDSQARGA